ncbi:hypothetical protein PG984_003470 [Apiospora sp. TS-2023a]
MVWKSIKPAMTMRATNWSTLVSGMLRVAGGSSLAANHAFWNISNPPTTRKHHEYGNSYGAATFSRRPKHRKRRVRHPSQCEVQRDAIKLLHVSMAGLFKGFGR